MSSFGDSIGSLEGALRLLDEKREEVLKAGREVVRLSAKAILHVHSRREGGEELVREASSILHRVKDGCPPKFIGILTQAEAELVEAKVVLSLVKERRVPSFLELGAEPESYLLGLLDAIGEMKRMFYDLLGKRDDKVVEVFEAMDLMYSSLAPLSEFNHVAQGVKRKVDVARYAVEGARAALAEELRRRALINSLKRVSNE